MSRTDEIPYLWREITDQVPELEGVDCRAMLGVAPGYRVALTIRPQPEGRYLLAASRSDDVAASTEDLASLLAAAAAYGCVPEGLEVVEIVRLTSPGHQAQIRLRPRPLGPVN